MSCAHFEDISLMHIWMPCHRYCCLATCIKVRTIPRDCASEFISDMYWSGNILSILLKTAFSAIIISATLEYSFKMSSTSTSIHFLTWSRPTRQIRVSSQHIYLSVTDRNTHAQSHTFSARCMWPGSRRSISCRLCKSVHPRRHVLNPTIYKIPL